MARAPTYREVDLATRKQAVRRGQVYIEASTENMVALIGVPATVKRLKAMIQHLEEFE